jgi:signal transduction histidine kinase
LLSKLKKSSIINKIVFTFAVNIIILFSLLALGYNFTKQNTEKLSKINKQLFLVAKYHNSNLKLLKEIATTFSDAVLTHDLELTHNDRDKDIILGNFYKLSKLGENTHADEKMFHEYYQYTHDFTIKMMQQNGNIDYKQMVQMQTITQNIMTQFEDNAKESLALFHKSIKEVSNNTEEFFYNSIYVTIFGVFIFIFNGIFIYILLTKRFNDIIYSIKDLSENKPDFSSRLECLGNDELDEVKHLINKLKDKLEHDYNHLENIKEDRELELFEKTKMAALGEMIGNIAHQWRQPLSLISVLASAMEIKSSMGTLNHETIKKDTNNILESVDYLSETIETFRNFLNEKKELSVVSVQDKIDIALGIEEQLLGIHKITLEKDIDYSTPLEVKIVTGELTQILMNLINNAKDAIVENEIENGWVKVSLKKIDTDVIITVEDNAGGIPDKILPKIFDEYFTTKDTDKGTGLGLYMSKKIMLESMHGDLTVENTQNGAQFTMAIPLNKS